MGEQTPARFVHAVAVDYDGTIASGGIVDPEALAAIDEARRDGLRVVLVTGRILAELRAVFPTVDDHFDAVVAEDGTVLARHGVDRALVAPVPRSLDRALEKDRVPHRRGQVLLACRGEDDRAVLDAITRLGLDCQLVRNRGELMVLPPGCSKGSGLVAALAELDLSPHNTVAVGDAQNDHSLLSAAEIGVAVADAVDALKDHADLVTDEPGGRGVAALLRGDLVAGRRRLSPRRWELVLGATDGGERVAVPGSQVDLLVAGGSGAGKSYLAGLVAEGLVAMGYSVLVLDPEGDHMALGRLHGVFVVGGDGLLPPPEAVAGVLGHGLGSVVVDLSSVPADERDRFRARLPAAVEASRRHSGHPHWVVLDEAHLVLGPQAAVGGLPPGGITGYCLVTYRPEDLPDAAVDALDAVVALPHRLVDRAPLVDLVARVGALEPGAAEALLGSARVGQAVLVARDRPGEGVVFTVAPRATRHVRHWHKYEAGGLPPHRRFHFRRGPDERTGATAGSVDGLVRELARCDPAVVEHHCRGGDLSRWIVDVLGDVFLAASVALVEDDVVRGALDGEGARGRLLPLLHSREPTAG